MQSGSSITNQKGLSLFFVLLGLLVMSIAAVAVIRSVADTGTAIVGNVYFKKIVNMSAHNGIEAIMDTLGATSFESSYVDSPAIGYYSRCNKFDKSRTCDGGLLDASSSVWEGSGSVLANSDKAAVLLGIDANKSEIRYVVERMCNYTEADSGKPAEASRCVMSAGSVLEDNMGCSNNSATAISGAVMECANQQVPMYRATFRVVGPKHTVSIFQLLFS